MLLGTFSVGIGLGSYLCEKMSGHRVELGLVPLGSIGLSAFGPAIFSAAKQKMLAEKVAAEKFKTDCAEVVKALEAQKESDFFGTLQEFRDSLEKKNLVVESSLKLLSQFQYIEEQKHLSNLFHLNNSL